MRAQTEMGRCAPLGSVRHSTRSPLECRRYGEYSTNRRRLVFPAAPQLQAALLGSTALHGQGDREVHPCPQLLERRWKVVGRRERAGLPEQDVIASVVEVCMSQRLLTLRNTRSAPIIELFDQGLSFQLMLSWGILPPLQTMNEFLACGRDDTDAEDGLVEWEPVALTKSDYARLVRDLKQRGHNVQLDSVRAGTSAPSYEEWFASQLAKRPPRNGTRKRSPRS
jgi:hypothetical protein